MGLLLAACSGHRGGGQAAAAPGLASATLVHGPFEIEAGVRRVSTGSFPNQGGNPFASREVSEFRVRHRGQAVAAAGGDDRYLRVLRLDGAPRPALLLVTTGFVLAAEDAAGRLQLTPIRSQSSSLAELQWLDSRKGQPGEPQSFGIEAVRDLQAGTRLAGGRWLRLGSRSVLDVATLSVHGVEPWLPSVPGKPSLGLGRNGDVVRAFSPGRTQYVLDATGYDHALPGAPVAHGLLVVDIRSGTAYELRTDRRRFRFADSPQRDAAWIDHHFAWQRDATGTERLVVREAFEPWPWRARMRQTRPGHWELDVPRIDGAFLSVLQRLLLQAEPGLAIQAQTSAAGPGLTFTLGGCAIQARAFGTSAAAAERQQLSVWPINDSVSGPDALPCEGALRRLAGLIDAELAGGRHDALLRLDE